MANYATLKAEIQQYIKQNGYNEITGNLLQQELLAMVDSLGTGYQCMGVAVLTPTPTNPGTPDANVFYIASEPGTYANFGNIVINDGEVCLLTYNGTWSKQVTGAATASQLNQLGQQALNIKGIFSRDSNFSTYNGIRIYDIRTNKQIPDDYKVGLCYIGVLNGTHIEILLTKDCSSALDYTNYLAELYLPISDISQDEIQTLTIPAKNPSLYGNIEYYITLNANDLITIDGLYYNSIFFDEEYINSKNALNAVNKTNMLYLKSIAYSPFYEALGCVKRFDVYLPNDLVDKEWKISEICRGSDGYFYVGIYYFDENNNRVWLYGQTSATAYITIPQFGVSKIPLETYYLDGVGIRNDVRFDVEIDWSLFSDPVVPVMSNTGIQISPIVGGGQAAIDFINGGIIKGNITLNYNITIPAGVQVIGNNCTVNLNGHTITLSENSGLHNIKFYDNWDINRTINLEKECGFDPSLTITDIKNVLEDDSLLGTPSIIIPYSSAQNAQIDGCTFYKIGGIAVKASSESHRSNQQPVISNCYFNECKCGLQIDGEFIRVNNCFFDNCYYGFYVKGGNSNICNCDVKRCDCGVLMKGGGNAMHGQMANVEVAHCMVVGLFVRDNAVNLGYVFNGCHFADASIESDECHSLMFNGCRMETWFKIDSGSKISIHNSIFSKVYAVMYQVPFLDFPEDTSLMGNRGISYCTDADVNNMVLNP